MNDVLSESNFIIYAAKNYDNPTFHDTEEFIEDLRRFKYIKKLFTRYKSSGDLKERLILNHLIVLTNVFPPEPLSRMIALKMESQLSLIKPFLLLLNVYQPRIRDIKSQGTHIDMESVIMDPVILRTVQNISKMT
jgi:hypothetical protein